MSKADSLTLNKFIPSPGNILLERLEETDSFKEKPKEEDNPCYKAKVLKVGADVFTDNGVPILAPCSVGDIVLYKHVFSLPTLEIEFKKYPIANFNLIMGVFE